MTASAPISKPVVRRAAFVVDKERRRQFAEVLDYVETFHQIIDPDMYRIDLEKATSLPITLGIGRWRLGVDRVAAAP